MKFFSIPPIAHLRLAEQNDNYFCLAQYCEVPSSIRPPANVQKVEYYEFFRRKVLLHKHVILDNGAAENALVPIEEYALLTSQLEPTEVVCPDAIGDANRTLHMMDKFMWYFDDQSNRNPNIRDTKLIGVPQGSTISEWLYCLTTMLHSPRIKVIGLSKFAVQVFKEITLSDSIGANRKEAISMMQKYRLLTRPIHLLGMRDYDEFYTYINIPEVRSSDSCFPILAASNDKSLVDQNPNITTPESYFHQILNVIQLDRARNNIMALNEFADGRRNMKLN